MTDTIAVDTSALMAIILGEPTAPACRAALTAHPRRLMSAATVAECLIVAEKRNVLPEMERTLEAIGFETVDLTLAAARRVADAHRRFGRGVHPAALNYGDCFSYDVARVHGCPLLFVGEDFTRTDIAAVLRL